MEDKFSYLISSISFVLGTIIIFSDSQFPSYIASQNPNNVENQILCNTSQFNIIFRYGVAGAKYRNELNTFNCTFTKDMVNKPPVQTRLYLNNSEMEAIYNEIVEIDFFSYPTIFDYKPSGDIIGTKHPYSIFYLEVRNGTMTHGVAWNDKHVMQANNSYVLVGDERYDGLLELVYFIKHIIYAQPEYQGLPRPSAGYA